MPHGEVESHLRYASGMIRTRGLAGDNRGGSDASAVGSDERSARWSARICIARFAGPRHRLRATVNRVNPISIWVVTIIRGGPEPA